MKPLPLFLSLALLLGGTPLLQLQAQSNLEDISTSPAETSTGEKPTPATDNKATFLPPKAGIREEVTLDYAYAGGADLKSAGTIGSGSLQEQSTHLGYNVLIPIDDKWSVRWGLADSRLDFGRPARSPLPQNLQTLTMNFGAQYKIDSQWTAFGGIAPRLSLMDGWDRVNSQEVAFGGMLGARYDVNRDLAFTFGLGINPGNNGLPVMPLVGVHWGFAKDWTLDVGIPRTAVSYQLLPNLRLNPLLVGFDGGTFHTSKTYGNAFGMPQLNDRQLQYTEVRVGTGASYFFQPTVSLDLTGGVIAYRQFDFKDAGYSPKVDPAPYVQLGLRIGF